VIDAVSGVQAAFAPSLPPRMPPPTYPLGTNADAPLVSNSCFFIYLICFIFILFYLFY